MRGNSLYYFFYSTDNKNMQAEACPRFIAGNILHTYRGVIIMVGLWDYNWLGTNNYN